ncbi:MAG: methionyl-tRNA formyltransferase [Proteobacteria bacterium]|nr:methionyl-tRNA formyltransferase [Pseudomonadota bacterium]MDA1058494.1 methionyl-tRNA formyltransferase [Pseudomonadota bacterium]
MRVVFMGTPDFAVPVLRTLLADHQVVCVYTQPPRPAGRGHRIQVSPVQGFAELHGIDVRTPRSLKAATQQELFAALAVDIAVVAAYGLILPKTILEAPKLGCVNVHASLLPRWRGAAPIQRAILAGDTQTGACLMKMDEGLDTGAVYACHATPIDDRTTAASLHDRLAEIGSDLVREYLPKIASGAIVPEAQPDEGITYAAKIDRKETRIVWENLAELVVRQINAFSPNPGAWSNLAGERLKILTAVVVPGAGLPGQSLSDDLVVACGAGAIRVEKLQLAGRQILGAADFLSGRSVPVGTVFT